MPLAALAHVDRTRHLRDRTRLRWSPPLRESSIAASVVADMLQYLERNGISAETATRECGIEPRLSFAADDRVAGSVVERLWQFAVLRTGDPLVGLHMAETYSPGALDILGYVVLSCRTVGDVLDRVAKYMPILNDGMRIDIVREGKRAYCRCTFVESMDNYLLRDARQPVDTTWAGIARELRRLTPKPLAPAEVWLRRSAPSSQEAREYVRVFGSQVKFGTREDRFYLPVSHLDERLHSANPALLHAFEQHADGVIARLDTVGSRSQLVAGVLAQRLKGSVPALKEVARALSMSDRNLQRALRNDGTTYQKLLDQVRRDLAISHLGNAQTSASQVGFLLGFSEPSAFHRAFRRWTGKAPNAYRADRIGAINRPA
ncbi:MAG TPA: AraC family transcriptional regulator [Gemmatimonadaceae bacterium]|nr:AraC family transcriptional regulator [Gemmatimonadaceae bacterium]